MNVVYKYLSHIHILAVTDATDGYRQHFLVGARCAPIQVLYRKRRLRLSVVSAKRSKWRIIVLFLL